MEILQREFGYQKAYSKAVPTPYSRARTDFFASAVNRLDRLTSGLMIIGLSSSRAHVLSQEFVKGEVKKEYIARCSGEFPAEEVVVDQPLLTVDRQMGLNIVHPEGKVRMRHHSKYRFMTDLTCQARKIYIHAFALRQKHEHERTPLYVLYFGS